MKTLLGNTQGHLSNVGMEKNRVNAVVPGRFIGTKWDISYLFEMADDVQVGIAVCSWNRSRVCTVGVDARM